MKITKQNTSHINYATAFKLADNILQKWGCSIDEKQAILDLTASNYQCFQKNNDRAKLSNDQLERISYVANIHQSLRIVFSNPENVYGFMRMNSSNPFFNGRSPISLIFNCSLSTLHEVFKRIDAMRKM